MSDNTSYSEWTLYYTEDGYRYYYNSVTSESIWADAEAVSDQTTEQSSCTEDKPSLDRTMETHSYDREKTIYSAPSSNKSSSKENDAMFMQYLSSDEGKQKLKSEVERVKEKFIKKSINKELRSKGKSSNQLKEEELIYRKNKSIDKKNQSYNNKQYGNIKQKHHNNDASYNHKTSSSITTNNKNNNNNSSLNKMSSEIDNDDVESLCSDNNDDDDLEFEQLLKDEFSTGTEWNDLFNQACQYISDHFMMLVSPPNMTTSALTKQRNRLGNQLQHSTSHRKSDNSDTSDSVLSSFTSVIKKLISLFISICFLLFSSIIHHTALIFSEVVFRPSDWKSTLDYLDEIDTAVQVWIKSIDNHCSAMGRDSNGVAVSSSSSASQTSSSINKSRHQQESSSSSSSFYHSDDKTSYSNNKGDCSSENFINSPQKYGSNNLCSIYRECIDTDDEINNNSCNSNSFVANQVVDCVYMDV